MERINIDMCHLRIDSGEAIEGDWILWRKVWRVMVNTGLEYIVGD